VSLGGKAGTGKSAAGVVCGSGSRAGAPDAAQGRGFSARCMRSAARSWATCPAARARRWAPGPQAVFDTLEGLASPAVLEEVLSRGMLEVLPLTHIRGRSLHDSFVIVDEAQVAGAKRAADRAVPVGYRVRGWC